MFISAADFAKGGNGTKTTTPTTPTKSGFVSAADFVKTQPVEKPTLGSKVLNVGKELVKGIVSPVATMVARPIQLGAELLGASDQAVNQFTKDKFGDWVAPTPQNTSDVIKDIGRAGQTVLLGAGGAAFKGAKLGTTIAKEAAIGAGFGAGTALEQKGSQITAKDFLKQSALGGVIGAVAPVAIKGASKLIKGKTPAVVEKVVYSGEPVTQETVGGTKFYTPNKETATKYAEINKDVTGQAQVVTKDISGLNLKKVKQSEMQSALEDPIIKQNYDGIEFSVKGEKEPSYAIFDKPKIETPIATPVETPGFKNISYTERTNILNQQTQQHIEDVVFNGAKPEGGLPKEAYIAHLYNQADNNPALAERLATSGIVTEAESQAGQNLGALAQAVKGTTVGIIRDAHQALKKALPGYVQKGEKKAVTEIQSKIKGVIDTFTDKSLTIEERLSVLDILKCK